MSEHAISSVNISAITAADALDKLRITNIFRKLTSADVERVRRLLFRRCNDSAHKKMRFRGDGEKSEDVIADN